jgi:hypothetical protein
MDSFRIPVTKVAYPVVKDVFGAFFQKSAGGKLDRIWFLPSVFAEF